MTFLIPGKGHTQCQMVAPGTSLPPQYVFVIKTCDIEVLSKPLAIKDETARPFPLKKL